MTLFEAGKFSIATGVAMFGREELGRYKILRKLADEVAKGSQFTVAQVRGKCDGHDKKQAAAALSNTTRTQRGTPFDAALRTLTHETPGFDRWRKANEVLAIPNDKEAKRTPANRHSLRMKSYYVDLQPDGVSWHRPREFCTSGQAHDEVTNALNDHAFQRDRLTNLAGDDPEMAAALTTMNPAADLIRRRPGIASTIT